jgi:hypothetical protein
MTPVTLKPQPTQTLPLGAANTSRTDSFPVTDEARVAFLSTHASDLADDFVIALQVRDRSEHALNPEYWTPLEDVIREYGHDPADFGIE